MTVTLKTPLRVLRHEPVTAVALLALAIVVLIGIFAPWLGTIDPTLLGVAPRAGSPSPEHWFGSDLMGRDMYSRTLYGARVSLTVGLLVTLFSVSCGLVVGLLSGSIRWVDSIVMRVMDGLMSIPSILLAIALVAIQGGSLSTVVLAITIVEIPRVARLVRGNILSLREQPFIDAAIASGSTVPKVIFRHVMPNLWGPVIVQAALIFAHSIMIEAGLSFIGAGVPPEVPSWGNIIAQGRVLWQVKPYLVMIPAVFLAVTVLSINIIGDSLRDRLDPRRRISP